MGDKPLHVSAGVLAQNHRKTSVTEGGESSGLYAQICRREHFTLSDGEKNQTATDYCLGVSRFEEKSDGREGLFNAVEQTRTLLQFGRIESGKWHFNETKNYIGFGESNDYDHLILGKDLFSGGAVWHFEGRSGPGISGRLFLSQFVANNLDPMGNKDIPLLSLKLGIDLRLVWGPELKENLPEVTTGFDVAYLLAVLGHTLLQNQMTSQALTSPAAELTDPEAAKLLGVSGVASPELEDTSLLQGLGIVGGAMQQNTFLAAGQKASSDQQTLLRVGQIGAGTGYLILSGDDASNSLLTQGLATLMHVAGDFADAALLTRLLIGSAGFVVGGLLAAEEPKGAAFSQAGFQNLLATVMQPELDATLGNHRRSGFGLMRINEDGSRQIGGGTRTDFENGLFTEWSLTTQTVPVTDDTDPVFDELARRNPLTDGARVSLTTAFGKQLDITDHLRASAALRGSVHFGNSPAPVPALGAQGDLSLKLLDIGEYTVRAGAKIFAEYYADDIHTGWSPMISIGNE